MADNYWKPWRMFLRRLFLGERREHQEAVRDAMEEEK